MNAIHSKNMTATGFKQAQMSQIQSNARRMSLKDLIVNGTTYIPVWKKIYILFFKEVGAKTKIKILGAIFFLIKNLSDVYLSVEISLKWYIIIWQTFVNIKFFKLFCIRLIFSSTFTFEMCKNLKKNRRKQNENYLSL